MKLRNKKTGEIGDLMGSERSCPYIIIDIDFHNGDVGAFDYKSLAELNEEWEDYTPKDEIKKYRLKKDLPTFKAGEVFELDERVGVEGLYRKSDCIMAYTKKTLDKFPNILTDWFEPIDGEDTNVLSKEPLIKDEKIRKAVRAWAEINAIRRVSYVTDSRSCRLTDLMENYDYCIDFVGWIPTLNDMKSYTIAELCGEERE